MNNDDLRRRLEKLVALRDHPSTLPAIRDEAARAYDRLNTKRQEPRPGRYYRGENLYCGSPDDDPMVRSMMREINRQMARMVFPWDIHKPERR